MYPGWTGLLGHQWILDEKCPGTVPCARSPIWMLSLLLQWLGPKVKVGVLRPVQQPGSYWDRPSELPLVRLEPTEVTAVAWEAEPLVTLNSWSIAASLSALVPPARLHVSDLSEGCALALKPSLAGIFGHVVVSTKLFPHSLPL